MCGIAGSFGPTPAPDDRIRQALGTMKRRGPDHQASVRISNPRSAVALLHSRLSIIDLDPRSHQPFRIGDHTIVFNGEIYNYVELRAKLANEGETFTTDSDTEVLLRSYLKYGEDCLRSFEGMWSFAIYDGARKTLFLSRDRTGEKPLYWASVPQGFCFASEPKAIFALTGRSFPVNRRQLTRYLVNGYKALYKGNDTFFEGLLELPPGHSMTVTETSVGTPKRYWTLDYRPEPMTYAEAVSGVAERLKRSLTLRLRSDVPLAFCLSGGVDSAGLASMAVKDFGASISTFSIIDEDPRYNESGNIGEVVRDLGCANRSIRLSREGFWERMTDLIRYHDGPVATVSYYVHSFLSEAIAAEGFKVAISGTGADELFTGYFDHFNLFLAEMEGRPEHGAHLKAWSERIQPVVRNPYLRDPRLFADRPGFRDHIYLDRETFASYLKGTFAERFEEERRTGSILRNRMLNELFHEVIPVILHEDDLNSMRYSVENRSPYLDRELMEFAYRIPSEHLMRDGRAKSVLRDALRGTLAETVRTDPHKKGFNASILTLVDLNDPATRERLTSDGPVFDIVDRSKVQEMLSGDFTQNSFSKFLFSYLNVKIFMETYG
jgi:asparagine synthase (glutamine-hydrolysing)